MAQAVDDEIPHVTTTAQGRPTTATTMCAHCGGGRRHIRKLRLWREAVAEGEPEWRGRIYDTTTGDIRYFREWAGLIPLFLAMLRDAEQTQESTSE